MIRSVSHLLRRARISQQAPSSPLRGRPAAAPILDLHRLAGNRAVASLVSIQRNVGWTDAKSPEGYKWNQDERPVGKVRRIPLEGLTEGSYAKAKKAVADTSAIPELTSESAVGKAIVLVPDALDATQSIDVLVFLHGHTEGTHRPFGGYRTLDKAVPKASPHMQNLRRGIDATDTAPVRDVALDQAAQQLDESGEKQLVIILPQGGLYSQFSKEGTQDFDAGPYVKEIVNRLATEKRWKDGAGQVVTSAPPVTRITMSGHSGAGAALSHMADVSKLGVKPGASSRIPGDLVIYDAINGDQLTSFTDWAIRRLDEDLLILTDPAFNDQDKLVHLRSAPKLLGYTTDSYIWQYIALDNAIEAWFTRNKAKLGQWADCLRANYRLEYVDVDHEELMRGSKTTGPRAKGTGNILDAIKSLNALRSATLSACPPWPRSLIERYYAVHPERKPKPKAKATAGAR